MKQNNLFQSQKDPKFIYIAHPIAGDIQANALRVAAICREVQSESTIPIAPYLAYMDDSTPQKRELGMKANRVFFQKGIMDEIWLCGPKISSGMREEVKWALEYRIPIHCHNSDLESELQLITRSFDEKEGFS